MILTVEDGYYGVLTARNLLVPQPRLQMLEGILEREIEAITYGRCAGLAAPQVGSPYRAFIALGVFYADVESLQLSGGPRRVEEGCYSLTRGRVYPTIRFERATFTYRNVHGVRVEGELTGWPAQVFQHEYDHCIGTLLDMAPPGGATTDNITIHGSGRSVTFYSAAPVRLRQSQD